MFRCAIWFEVMIQDRLLVKPFGTVRTQRKLSSNHNIPSSLKNSAGISLSGSWAIPRGLPTDFMPYSSTAALLRGGTVPSEAHNLAPASSILAPVTNPGVGVSRKRAQLNRGLLVGELPKPWTGCGSTLQSPSEPIGRQRLSISSRWQPPPTAAIPDRLAFGGIVTRLEL